ncbi:MAG: TolC family protein [Spirochaetales bacterium]|nr:TolC family protein [Spirochaetales bacterium]
MKNKIFLLLFFIIIFISNLYAQSDVLNLSIDEAWLLMEKNNSELKQLLINKEGIIREMTSKGYLIPSIGLSSGISRSSPLISTFTNSDTIKKDEIDNWSFRGSFDIRYSIDLNKSLEDQILGLEYKLLIIQYESKIDDLYSNLKKLYYQISGGERTIALQDKIFNLSQTRFEQVEKQYNKGLVSELDLLTSKISVARDKPLLEKAKNDQEKRFITLKQYLGIDANSKINIINLENIEKKDKIMNDQLSEITERNYDVQQKEIQLEIAIKNKMLTEKKQKNPTFGVSLGWSSNLSPVSNDWSDNTSFGLSFSLPIDSRIKGSSSEIAILKMEDSIMLLKMAVPELKRVISDKIRSISLDIELSEANLKMKELNIQLQEENYNKIRQNYENGRASLLDVDNNRQELQKSLVAFEDELLNYNLLMIDLYKLYGNYND